MAFVGHSWGLMHGIRMIANRPELFSVYVGAGQHVNLGLKIGYPRGLATA
jgi:hypothetical protein